MGTAEKIQFAYSELKARPEEQRLNVCLMFGLVTGGGYYACTATLMHLWQQLWPDHPMPDAMQELADDRP